MFTLFLLLLAPLNDLRAQPPQPSLTDINNSEQLQQLQSILKRFAFDGVHPPTQAQDFTLPMLRGGKKSLSDYQGQWVVLNFFATWCGPCAAEMPELETLHRAIASVAHTAQKSQIEETAKPKFVLLAVAVGDNKEKVERYTRQRGVTFPIFLDDDSQVASIYKAWSIPLAYLISPTGQVVGLARGARPWKSFIPVARALGLLGEKNAATINTLLSVIDTPNNETRGRLNSGADTGIMEIPEDLIPPTATVLVSSNEVELGTRIWVKIRVEWSGTLRDYLLLPPKIELPDGIEQIEFSASSSSTMGDAVIVYTMALEAKAAGTYKLDPISLRFTPRGQDRPLSQRLEGPTVTVTAPMLLGTTLPLMSKTAHWGIALMVLLITVIAGTFLWQKRRSQKADEKTQNKSGAHTLIVVPELLKKIEKSRIDGNTVIFLEHVIALYALIDIPLEDNIEELYQQVRFAGVELDTHRLQQIELAAQRAVQLN